MKIVSAITTCPRAGGSVSYVGETIASIHAAGFDEPGQPAIIDDPWKTGSWPALHKALARLLAISHEPDDALIVFQDDVKVARGLYGWLEKQLWAGIPAPVESIGVVSLYTPQTSHLRPGWFTMDELPVYRPHGACALCFPRHAAEKMVGRKSERAMLTGSDTQTAMFCRWAGLAYFLHSPSLVEHVGAISSILPKEMGLEFQGRTAGKWCEDVKELEPNRV